MSVLALVLAADVFDLQKEGNIAPFALLIPALRGRRRIGIVNPR